MKLSKKAFMITALSLMMTVSSAGFVFGAVSAEEAAQLGKNLTLFGSEKAGNADGTIPPYTGGLTKVPDTYKPGSGRYTDPFAGEKPLFSINAKNMNQYAAKLTEGTKALMKKYPEYRIDVYQTHRTVAYPQWLLKNTAEKCAVNAKTAEGGLSLEGARACIPFPIPKTGYEIMWNHLTSYKGKAWWLLGPGYLRDRSGRLLLVGLNNSITAFPFYDENPPAMFKPYYQMGKDRAAEGSPPRQIGGAAMAFEPLNLSKMSRLCYFYSAGQRRVRLAPEFDFDTPTMASSGSQINDEGFIFNGSLEKYDWKLVGKKEMYIPYNDYRLHFWVPWEQLMLPHYANPDHVRWELHRVWVVEATLKKGMRHIYPLRRLYIDEDSWRGHAAELYDVQGFLVKADFSSFIYAYDVKAPYNGGTWDSNLLNGISFVIYIIGPNGFIKYIEPPPQSFWSPETLAGGQLR
jgi:hypothetical protein